MKRFNHNRHTTFENRKLRLALSVREDCHSLTEASQIGRQTDASHELKSPLSDRPTLANEAMTDFTQHRQPTPTSPERTNTLRAAKPNSKRDRLAR